MMEGVDRCERIREGELAVIDLTQERQEEETKRLCSF